MAPHPLPTALIDNCEGMIYCLAQWAFDVTQGFYWVALLLGFIVVLVMATIRFGTPRAYGFASVSGLLASIWLVTLNLIPYWISTLFILNGVVGLAVLIMNER